MLLVAHTNHIKLKYAVEEYIIKFGQDFGVVNHLMNSHPTEKMVEAVCEAYAAFSKFLAKAVKYYKESRMTLAIKAFGFPWETRFQVLVNKIEGAFQRIKDIASAGHFGMTAQMHQMVATLGCRQEKLRHEMRQNTLELQEKLKFEMRNEVHRLFEEFDRNWISRFEQIMNQSIQGRVASSDSGERKTVSGGKMAAIEYAETITESAFPNPGKNNIERLTKPKDAYFSVTPSASFLADHVGKPKRLKRFRDKSFVHLQKLDRDYIVVKLRLRYTTTQDLRQIMSLLHNDTMRGWLLASSSGLIWINAVKQPGPSDWATAFAVRMVEDAAKVDNMAVLHHFCGNHPASSPVSAPAVMLQSLIMQLIEQRHKHFGRKDFSFTLEYFRDAQDDIHELWDLFLKCCAEAKVPGIWLVLDHFDNLARNEDYNFVIQALLRVVRDGGRVFKVFFSARTAGTPDEVTEVAAQDSSVSIITVLKTSTTTAAALASKHKRAARLPDEPSSEQPAVMASKVEIDALLHSSSENEQVSDKGSDMNNKNRSHLPVADDTDLDSSDGSMKFMRDDPFASTDDDFDDGSDVPMSKPASNANKPGDDDDNDGDDDDDDDDDDDEDFFFAKPSGRRTPSNSTAADLPASSDTSDDSSDGAPAMPRASANSKGQLQPTSSNSKSRVLSV